jgi:hypothetical protein
MENSLFQAMVDRKLGGKGNGKLCVERELKRRRRRRRRSRSWWTWNQESVCITAKHMVTLRLKTSHGKSCSLHIYLGSI